ncbi:MAG TPA: S8 family serine peptidase [Galbitalea sp.]|nr:S8 family serine peptidase [Galbitalea sp.]
MRRLRVGGIVRARVIIVTVTAAAASILLLTGSSVPMVAHTDSIRSGEYWLSQYGISSAWATTQGKGITIAVIDTGVDGTVADLAGAVSGGTDFSGQGAANGERPVGDADERNHGTMVASLAAGRGTAGGDGLIGVAPQAKILSISIGFGAAVTNSDDQIAEAVTWAVNHGANIINMSLTRNTLAWPESWDKAFLYAMQHNVVIVAAAGNRGSGTTEVGAPATMPGVLTVAGVDRNEKASVDASAQGITIGVSAPSEQLLGAIPGGQYVEWEGTSGSTPIVSGVVALVMASHPGITAANAINRVISTATDAGAKGVDPIYGYGLVNAAAAVRNTVPSVKANPMGSLAAWIHLNRRAEPTATPTTPPTSRSTAAPAVAQGGPENPLGILYPTPTQLRNVGLPLGLILAFVLAALTMIVLAVRHLGRLRGRD